MVFRFMTRSYLWLILVGLCLMGATIEQADARSRVDQVLVIYNKDWTEDLDGSNPGQDSLELAEYYVKRRTDEKTGRKPWLLGLSSGDSKKLLLNETILKENSHDNTLGLLHKGGDKLSSKEWPLSNQFGNAAVRIDQIDPAQLPNSLKSAPPKKTHLKGILIRKKQLDTIDTSTLSLMVGSSPKPDQATLIYDAASHLKNKNLAVLKLKNGDLLFTGTPITTGKGTVYVWLSATKKNKTGQWQQRTVLYDAKQFKATKTGKDGVRDDQVYLDLIEKPIKQFLETHKTDDGILLKDHVLYIVVVRGLPLRVTSLFGVHRGTVSSTRRGDFGAGSALTQRLRMLYYQLPEKLWQPTIVPHGKPDRSLVSPSIGLPLRYSLIGPGFNPYMHPLTHNPSRRSKTWKADGLKAVRRFDPPKFTTELRFQKEKSRWLYSASRIDASDIRTAKAQIDGAIYAERYLTPKMGMIDYGRYQEGPLTAELLKAKGFETQPIPMRADRALMYFGVLSTGKKYAQDLGQDTNSACVWHKGFYPGSIGFSVRSFLGWDHRRPPRESVSLFEQLVRGGATVTAGSSGGAHDTNVTWPDSFVLSYLMFNGYEYGDALLRSSIYLDWTLSMVGDPLYCPDLSHTMKDVTPPKVTKIDDIKLMIRPAGLGRYAVEAKVTLSNDDPEMVEMTVICEPVHTTSNTQNKTKNKVITGRNTRYTAEPTAWAISLMYDTEYKISVKLIDPYGNTFDSAKSLKLISIITPKAIMPKVVASSRIPQKAGKRITMRLGNHNLDEAGEVHIWFVANKKGRIPGLLSDKNHRIISSRLLSVGGGAVDLVDWTNAIKPGKKYHMVVRWRRFPVTREVYLVAKDNSYHLVGSANNLPWNGAFKIGRWLVIDGHASVQRVMVFDDAKAGSTENRGVLPMRFDQKKFEQANGQ